MEDLKTRTLTGLFWNLLERIGLRIVQFVPTVILARLLSPEQFGLIGMLSLFIALAQSFLDSGFGLALIRKKDVSHTDECSIFYFNILLGVLSVLVLFFAAPLIAGFYQQPILIGLTRWLSLGIFIQSFGLIQTTLLTRALDFKTQLKARLFATVMSGVIGIAAALYGLGVWSLVIQSIAATLLGTLALWLMCDWRPALNFSLDSLKSMFGFGSRMLFSDLVNTFFDNLYQVFIGKFFSPASLGFYTRAASSRAVVIDTVSYTLGRVTFPAFSSIQDDLGRLKRAYRKAITLSTYLNFPLMLGLIVVAKPLFLLLFSAKWLGAVGYFQLLCVTGMLAPLQIINLQVLKVRGRSDLFFQLTLIRRSLIVLTVFLTYRWGISAMLVGQIVISGIIYFLNSFYSARLIDYPMKAQVVDILPTLFYTLLMAAAMLLLGEAFQGAGELLLLVLQCGMGVAVYLLVSKLARAEPLRELLSLRQQLPLFRPG